MHTYHPFNEVYIINVITYYKSEHLVHTWKKFYIDCGGVFLCVCAKICLMSSHFPHYIYIYISVYLCINLSEGRR